jgi:hypothetical protein
MQKDGRLRKIQMTKPASAGLRLLIPLTLSQTGWMKYNKKQVKSTG